MGNLDYKYHVDINDDYVIPDVMVACDRKHLKGGSILFRCTKVYSRNAQSCHGAAR